MNKRKTITVRINKKKNLWSINIDGSVNFEKLCKMLEKKFQLIPIEGYWIDIEGDDVKRYIKKNENTKNYKIGITHGEWAPFLLSPEKPNSNQFVEEIYEWLQTIDIPTKQRW